MPTGSDDFDLARARDGNVARLTFSRPPHNHVSVALLGALADALTDLDADPACGAVILASEGKAFCAGADLSPSSEAGGRDWLEALYAQAARLFGIAIPIVAEIQGPAVGAGLGLALAADARVGDGRARFWSNFVKLGTHPGFAITLTLPRLIGHQRAARMLLTGQPVRSDQALNWGLLDERAEDLAAASLVIARRLADAGATSWRPGLASAFTARTVVERDWQNALRASADYREGVRSVRERRAGVFEGR